MTTKWMDREWMALLLAGVVPQGPSPELLDWEEILGRVPQKKVGMTMAAGLGRLLAVAIYQLVQNKLSVFTLAQSDG